MNWTARSPRDSSDGAWLPYLRNAYREEEWDDDAPLAKADTAQRVAGLEEGVELLHEGLDEHAEALAVLEREFAKPFPDKARLHHLLCDSQPHSVISGLADMRDDLRRWTARVKAADKRALASWWPVLRAVYARLDDLCETYLVLERRIHARFSERELEEGSRPIPAGLSC